jgi:hypothetical protein
MSQEHAEHLFQIAHAIMVADGDRDHMNQSNLTCEVTQAIARYLRGLAQDAGFKDPTL